MQTTPSYHMEEFTSRGNQGAILKKYSIKCEKI